MTIKHHTVDLGNGIGGVYTLSCDRCGAYVADKHDRLFSLVYVYYGWAAHGHGMVMTHHCPNCVGYLKGFVDGRAHASVPLQAPKDGLEK